MPTMPRDAPSLSGEWKRILAELAELADGAIEWDQLDAALAEIRSLGAARLKARRPFQPSLPTLPSKHERSEIDQLERELAARQLELVALHSDVGRFERRYVRVCGRLMVELDTLNAEIARLKAQAAPGDLVLKDAARQADERACESREAAAAVDTSESPVGDVTPDLRRLYREVARLVSIRRTGSASLLVRSRLPLVQPRRTRMRFPGLCETARSAAWLNRSERRSLCI